MPQCTARAKRTGQQCQRSARAGYSVCIMHGAGKGAKRGGRPPIHGYYSKFLTPAEAVDFAHFKEHFDLTDDLAFAATKTYHAAGRVDPEHLPRLLEVPSKIAERRKRVLEGVTVRLDVDVQFLRGFIQQVFLHVTDPQARDALVAYVQQHLGEAAFG